MIDKVLVTVAALLGHTSNATTQIYKQPSEGDKAAAVAYPVLCPNLNQVAWHVSGSLKRRSSNVR